MKILQVCVDLDGGGIDRYLLNYCSKLSDIRFDFAIVDNKKVGILEKDIENLGSTIYRVPRQTGNARKNYQTLKKIMTENNAEKWINIEEAAEHLGVKPVTIRDWIRKEKGIPAHKIGRQWKFKVSELDAWVKSGNSAIN